MEDQIKQAVEKQLRSLNREYFSQKNLNPWIRECKDIYSPGHKDAFIGNGLIGLRVPPEGEPSVLQSHPSMGCKTTRLGIC